jgi:hypothetical protein
MFENFTNLENKINIDELSNKFKDLCNNQDKLINGYKILSLYEKTKGFYIGMLEIIFSNQNDKILTKLCCSSFNVFIKKNWQIEEYIEQSERLVN